MLGRFLDGSASGGQEFRPCTRVENKKTSARFRAEVLANNNPTSCLP